MLGNIFSFSGRTGRLGYLAVSLIPLAVLGFGFATLILGGSKGAGVAIIPLLLAILASVWINLAAASRRLRDMGWPIVVGIVAILFVPMFSLLLMIWPGKPAGLDTSVFSDGPDPSRPAKASKEQAPPSWIDRALAEASKSRPSAPAPAATESPRINGAMAAAQGPRSTFGLKGAS